MLIALLTVYLLGGGSFDLAQYLLDAQDAAVEEVADEYRRAQVVELFAAMRAANTQNQSDTLALLEAFDAGFDGDMASGEQRFLNALEQGAALRATQTNTMLDARFALAELLTEEEWQAVFN